MQHKSFPHWQAKPHQVALYIHTPFCSKICPYCAFYKKKWDSLDEEKAFISALSQELAFYAKYFPDLELTSIFWGGGTPNLLRTAHVQKIMAQITESFPLTPLANAAYQSKKAERLPILPIEVSMEMNPGLSSLPKLQAIAEAGINRASLGLQSMNDDELQFLGRQHSAEQSHKALNALKEAGFHAISADLIFGLPNSTVATLDQSLQALISHEIQHISTYHLSIEPNTPFKRRRQEKASSDMEAKQYKHIRNTLKKAGFTHYELSNFAKPGHESQHNLSYWTHAPYIGLGPGAHSFFCQKRYKQNRDLAAYINAPIPNALKRILNNTSPKTRSAEYINCSTGPLPLPTFPKSERDNAILTGLRLSTGIPYTWLNDRFNCRFQDEKASQIHSLQALGLLRKSKTHLQASKKGQLLLDTVILALTE